MEAYLDWESEHLSWIIEGEEENVDNLPSR